MTKATTYYAYLLILLTLPLLSSCEPEASSLERLGIKAGRAARDGMIDAEECQELWAYYQTIPDADAMNAAAWADLLGQSKTPDGDQPNLDCAQIPFPAPAPAPVEAGCPAEADRLNVYVENSWSIYPYLKTGFGMRKVIMGMPNRTSEAGQKIRYYLINDETAELDELPGKYAEDTGTLGTTNRLQEWLTQNKLKTLGDPRNSRLVELLNSVAQQTVRDCEPRMVFSDFIYSLNGNGNMQQEMKEVSTRMTTAFGDARRAGLAVLMIKFSGRYDGMYYSSDKTNAKFPHAGERPYYAWVIGSPAYLKTFAVTYNISTLTGYRHHAIIGPDQAAEPVFSILTYTDQDRKEPCEDPRTDGRAITTLDRCDDENDPYNPGISYTLAADLSKEILPLSYLENPANYRIDGGGADDNWRVESISDDPTVDNGDAGRVPGATHLLRIACDALGQRTTNLEIKLLDRRPAWLSASHTESDRAEEMRGPPGLADKTFGYRYLVDGVWTAYRPEPGEQTVFNLPITLRK